MPQKRPGLRLLSQSPIAPTTAVETVRFRLIALPAFSERTMLVLERSAAW
jgi:hypothetical protein